MSNDAALIDSIIARARAAQKIYQQDATQKRYDHAAQAVGWAIMQPTRNRELAELAVATTGLGNVEDKITKNHRKTLGLLRDIANQITCGVISEDSKTGITKIARPVGVVGAVVPSTNPIATPANNIINAIKCGNAIVLSPSPKGVTGCQKLLEYIYNEFDKINVPHDLVQMIPPPGTKERTQRLLENVDLVVVTGSQNNVKRAYTSGTPALAVGAGNVAVIIDETADLASAATKITASKTFDNATSCSSENSMIVVEAIYDAFIEQLAKVGGAVLPQTMQAQIISRLWQNGHLAKEAIAKDAAVLFDWLQITDKVPTDTKFIAVETDGIGADHPLSGEKLSRVAALYRAKDFQDAQNIAACLMAHYGAGHSVGIHSRDETRPLQLGKNLPTCRVIVNQAHAFATGGSFDNGMPFSLSMGCGSWGGNSIDDNLHWKHFLNITKVIKTIPPNEPSIEDIFADYWREVEK